MKIALVEDEKTHQDYIAGLFESAAKKLGIPLSMRVFESGESFLFSLEDEKPDAVLLDIQLQNMNGYEIAEMIRKRDKQMPIAFMYFAIIKCRKLKKIIATSGIPFMYLTGFH